MVQSMTWNRTGLTISSPLGKEERKKSDRREERKVEN